MRKYLFFVLLVLSCAANAAETFSFVHITDLHITGTGKGSEYTTAIAKEVNAMEPKPAFVIATGDLTDMGTREALEFARKALSAFEMPVYCVPGNHEVKWAPLGKVGFKSVFGYNSYYSFDHGGIHFVGLDTCTWLRGEGMFDRQQIEWLRNDLKSVGRQTPVVPFFHIWPRAGLNPGDLYKVLRPYNACLMLNGHYHSFQTVRLNGIVAQMSRNVWTTNSGYRIYEVAGNEIRGFIKLVGGDKTADGVISLATKANPVTILSPKPGEQLGSKVHIRASVIPRLTPYQKIECGIDNDYVPVTPDKDGIVDITRDYTGDPGRWRVTVRAVDADGTEWSDVVVVNIAPNAADTQASREAWRFQTSGPVQRQVTVSGDRLYFGNWAGEVYCLDAPTGKQVWRRDLGSDVISEIAVQKGTAYLGTADGRVLALDATTGRAKWEYRTGGPIQASPVVAEGKVFIGSGDQYFYALDERTGNMCWKHGPHRLLEDLPLYMNGTIYFPAWDTCFYALRAKDGSEIWKTQVGSSIYRSQGTPYPATDGRRIVIGVIGAPDDDRDILCLDAQTGNTVWKLRNPSGKSSCGYHSAAVDGDRLYITTEGGNVFCMSMADGKEVWQSTTGHALNDCRPTLSNGKLYLTGLWGGVFGFDMATGNKDWEYSTGTSFIFGRPSVWKNLVIVPSMDGDVTALIAPKN